MKALFKATISAAFLLNSINGQSADALSCYRLSGEALKELEKVDFSGLATSDFQVAISALDKLRQIQDNPTKVEAIYVRDLRIVQAGCEAGEKWEGQAKCYAAASAALVAKESYRGILPKMCKVMTTWGDTANCFKSAIAASDDEPLKTLSDTCRGKSSNEAASKCYEEYFAR